MKSIVKITIMLKKNNLPVKYVHPSKTWQPKEQNSPQGISSKEANLHYYLKHTLPFPEQKIQSFSSFPLKKLSRMQAQSTTYQFIKPPFLASSLQITLTNLEEG